MSSLLNDWLTVCIKEQSVTHGINWPDLSLEKRTVKRGKKLAHRCITLEKTTDCFQGDCLRWLQEANETFTSSPKNWDTTNRFER
jgi:hypothetical protein